MMIRPAGVDAACCSELREFMSAVEAADGVDPLSENKAMRLGGGPDAREMIAMREDGTLAGYAQATWHHGGATRQGHWAIEIVVAPDERASALTGDLIQAAHEAVAASDVSLWSLLPYVGVAAASRGWSRQRRLFEMRCRLPVAGLETELPGFRVSPFRAGVDEEAWLEANNAMFAGHPEAGDMTRRDLEMRIDQDWFDGEGFFVAWGEDRIVGTCWTKVHSPALGEIYIIGVIPGFEGRGLGKGLLGIGLGYLREKRRVEQAMLYVESDNERAVELYESLGFVTSRIIDAYAPPRPAPG